MVVVVVVVVGVAVVVVVDVVAVVAVVDVVETTGASVEVGAAVVADALGGVVDGATVPVVATEVAGAAIVVCALPLTVVVGADNAPTMPGSLTISSGIGTPADSRAPGSEDSSAAMIAFTATGIGTVSAHLRFVRFFASAHTEKMPFWKRVAPGLSQRQFLIAATPY